ncbi:MAG: hypothetical protein AAF443_08005 [Chlamydiota bacterium]
MTNYTTQLRLKYRGIKLAMSAIYYALSRTNAQRPDYDEVPMGVGVACLSTYGISKIYSMNPLSFLASLVHQLVYRLIEPLIASRMHYTQSKMKRTIGVLMGVGLGSLSSLLISAGAFIIVAGLYGLAIGKQDKYMRLHFSHFFALKTTVELIGCQLIGLGVYELFGRTYRRV